MTRHRLELSPDAEVELVAGMYTLPAVKRLTATAEGERLDDDAARLGSLRDLLAGYDG